MFLAVTASFILQSPLGRLPIHVTAFFWSFLWDYHYSPWRNHPHSDAIHVAGWVSLFTLHVIWPFLWIWATLYQPERGWGMQHKANTAPDEPEKETDIQQLRQRLSDLEHQVAAIQRPQSTSAAEK